MNYKKNIYLRSDASPSIGYGHFTRSLALAHMLKENYNCIFATVSPSAYQIAEISKVGDCITLSESDSYQEFISIVRNDDFVVLDNYFFDVEYQKIIKTKAFALVFVDDRKNISYYCDSVINHVIGIKESDIVKLLPHTKSCLGTDYALLRPAFLESMDTYFPISNNKVLVAMGGTDYYNFTYKIVKYLLANSDFYVEVLIGDAYKYSELLKEFDPSRINIHKNLNEYQIVNLIKGVMLVISPPSTFAYEVCSIGRSLIVGSFAPGHTDVAELLEDNNLALNCGTFENLDTLHLSNLINLLINNSEYYIENQKKKFNGSQKENIIKVFDDLCL